MHEWLVQQSNFCGGGIMRLGTILNNLFNFTFTAQTMSWKFYFLKSKKKSEANMGIII